MFLYNIINSLTTGSPAIDVTRQLAAVCFPVSYSPHQTQIVSAWHRNGWRRCQTRRGGTYLSRHNCRIYVQCQLSCEEGQPSDERGEWCLGEVSIPEGQTSVYRSYVSCCFFFKLILYNVKILTFYFLLNSWRWVPDTKER